MVFKIISIDCVYPFNNYHLSIRTMLSLVVKINNKLLGFKQKRARVIKPVPIQQLLGGMLLIGFLGSANAANFTVNQTFDGADALPGDGLCATGGGSCTLRAAVMETNALAGADSISIPAGTYSLELGNTGEDAAAEGDLDILDDVTITGADAATTIINGNSFKFRIFSILKRDDDSLPVVALNKLTLTQGLSDANGALIYNAGELALDDITLTDASPDTRAMVNDEGNFTMTNSRVTGNFTGIESRTSIGSNFGIVTITDSVFSNNISTTSGSAIYLSNLTYLIGNVTVLTGGNATINNSTFLNNESSYFGGGGAAIYHGSGSLNIDNCEFIGNIVSPGRGGGAIYSTSSGPALVGAIRIANSAFEGNTSSNFGGSLSLHADSVRIFDTTFTNNVATNGGGGAYLSSRDDIRMTRVIMSGNQTTNGNGGAILAGYGADFMLAESTLTNNTAGNMGGGIALTGGGSVFSSGTLRNNEISGNTAVYGGGIFTELNAVTLKNLTITGNTATADGGGLYQNDTNKTIDLVHVTLANNVAPSGMASNISNVSGTIRLNNTLLSAPSGSINCSGSITTLGYNLSSDASCGLGGVEGDQASIAPLLDILADNGGFNKTMALQAGSPAIDAGSTALCTTLNPLDQRYYYRNDAICDIGAYEFGSARAQSGTLAFSAVDFSANEGGGTATVTFSRTVGSEGDVTIPVYDTRFGTATDTDYPRDYAAIPLTWLEWMDGDNSDKSLVVTINDDNTAEGDETINLQFDNVSFSYGGANLGISTATVTIIDNDVPGEAQFDSASYTVSENGGFASIIVERIIGSTAVSIDYATSNGSAIAGTDYDASSGTLNFSIGETSKTFFVDIIDNVLTDGNRTINLTLSNPQGGLILGTPITAVLTIEDDDIGGGGSSGEIQFESDDIVFNEADGTVTITVNRINGSVGTVSVDYFANPTSVIPATFGSDYVLPNGTLVFADGETSKTITLSITDDALLEGDEDFWIDLDNSTGGAILGSNWYTLVTIIDDETGAGGGGGFDCSANALLAGELHFDSDAMSVNEDVGSVTVTVNRAFGCAGTVGVDFNVYFPLFTGTASASKGSDFNLADGTLTFADGVTSQTITFSIINDTVSEDDEAFIIGLEFPTGGVSFGMESNLTVTIIDDDGGSNNSTTTTDTTTDSGTGGGGGGGALNLLSLLGFMLVPVIRRRKQC